ncbi:hypothetical protein HELRODRAFT_186188 [Helobdella robusta]|uniref:Ubiquitin-like domain-containing protein n=1 Tax=Helobdella robusta TaxID=6412 RepID=T1FNS4_HELRO|nr:hypothetical protein HELRODRAFT_186188 [Helobdella robusta]ESN91849.1 hypothetical protein HELRODRAFT_186188 [Helobdella robusta]
MLRRYFRSMGGCIGFHNRGQRGSDASDDNVHVSHNRPLKHRKPKWKSNIRLTEAQLQAKREEFWDTAPAFEGRREIWDALKASVAALEAGDFQMAQVILDGANISLPNGTLMDCYDELGNRYQLPVYILSAPINLIKKDEEKLEGGACGEDDENSSACGAASVSHKKHCIETCNKRSSVKKEHLEPTGKEMTIRIRFATGEDQRLAVNSNDTVAAVKMALARSRPDINPTCIRFFFSGKQLNNKLTLTKAKIESNYTIQATVSEPSPSLASEKGAELSSKKSSKKSGKAVSSITHVNVAPANLRVTNTDCINTAVASTAAAVDVNINNLTNTSTDIHNVNNIEDTLVVNECDKTDVNLSKQSQQPKIFYSNLTSGTSQQQQQETCPVFTYNHDKQNTQLQQQRFRCNNNNIIHNVSPSDYSVQQHYSSNSNNNNTPQQQNVQQQQQQQSYYSQQQSFNYNLPTQHQQQHHLLLGQSTNFEQNSEN